MYLHTRLCLYVFFHTVCAFYVCVLLCMFHLVSNNAAQCCLIISININIPRFIVLYVWYYLLHVLNSI